MFNIIAVYQTVTFSTAPSAHVEIQTTAPSMWVGAAPSCLHAPSCLQAGHRIRRDALVAVHFAVHHLVAVRVSAGKI